MKKKMLKRTVKRIVLLSHAGTNIGDNLLAEVLEKEVGLAFPEHIKIDSFTINPVRTYTKNIRSLYPASFRWPLEFISYIKTLRRADLVVGFWAIQDLGSWRMAFQNLFPRFICFYLLPRLTKCNLAIVNVDAVALRTAFGKIIARFVFNNTPCLLFRNHTSAKMATKIGMRAKPVSTVDFGLLYQIPDNRTKNLKPYAVVNMRPYPGHEDKVIERLNEIAHECMKMKIERIVFLGMHQEDTKWMTFLATVSHVPVFPIVVKSPIEAARLISSARFVVAMRLHVQVLAIIAKIPVFTFGYHQKNEDIAKLTGTLNDFRHIASEDASLQFSNFLDRVASGKWEHNTAALEAAQKIAKSTFRYLQQFVLNSKIRNT